MPRKKKVTEEPVSNELALDAVLKAIEREYGKGAVFYLNDVKKEDVDVISTGSLALDSATGVGGLPRGKIVEVRGRESSGKTTLLLSVVANANRSGEKAVIIDTEHALDIRNVKRLGVDPDLTLISQPSSAEEALNIMHDFTASGQVAVVCLDSIAGLVSKEELEKKIGDPSMMKVASLMSAALKKMEIVAHKTNTLALFTNQFRASLFGKVGTGGNAIKYDTSVRLDLKQEKKLVDPADNSKVVGIVTSVELIKNKVFAPYRRADIIIVFGVGISKLEEIINLSIEYELVTQSGSWYSYKEDQIGQGRGSVRSWLLENPKIYTNLEAGIKEILQSQIDL